MSADIGADVGAYVATSATSAGGYRADVAKLATSAGISADVAT
jgi:hypothetical protein